MRYGSFLRSMPSALRHREDPTPTPLEAFARVTELSGVAFLDGGDGRSHLACEPRRRLRIERDGLCFLDGELEAAGDPVSRVARFLDEETSAGRTAIGALSYDL